MKRKSLFILFSILTINTFGQVSQLDENFDISCSTTGLNYPNEWSEYNIINPVTTLAWNCVPTHGRYGTPGLQCLGYYSWAYHLDTAWLFTPQLLLSGFTGNVYLNFDSKYEVGISGREARLSICKFTRKDTSTTKNPMDTLFYTFLDLTDACVPIVGNADSFGWVTHQLDLTPFKASPLYISFRYTSTTSDAGAWTIDNVHLTTFLVNVNNITVEPLPIEVIGNSTKNKISLSLKTTVEGNYNIDIFDLLGRTVYKNKIVLNAGKQNIEINDFENAAGMYFIKISNEKNYGVVKAILN